MLQVSEGTDDAATSYLVHLLSDLNTLLKKVSSGVRHQGDNSCGYVVVQFYPWIKFYFSLFQTHYHTLSYPNTKRNKI